MILFRRTHEAIVAALRQRIADLERDAETLRARETALVDHVVKLATPAAAPTVPVRTSDPVMQAIQQRAGADARLRAHLAFWAKEQRRRDPPMADDEIAACILDWARASDVPADPDESAVPL